MKVKICKRCGENFDCIQIIDNKKHNLHSRKLCLNCWPLNRENERNTCIQCGKEFYNRYCDENGVYHNCQNRKSCPECQPIGDRHYKRPSKKPNRDVDYENNTRLCDICKIWLPNNEEYFYKYTKRNCFKHVCKICENKQRCVDINLERRRVKKILIDEHGGKCIICGYSESARALCFHHLDPQLKEFQFNGQYKFKNLEKYKSELEKCILVCMNCHVEIHEGLYPQYLINYSEKDFNPNKMSSKILLYTRNRNLKIKNDCINYKGGFCVKCKYNTSPRALCFHHLNPDEKEYGISSKKLTFENLKIELDKCDILCGNCHMKEHERLELEKLKINPNLP